jgi:hypothetical protein
MKKLLISYLKQTLALVLTLLMANSCIDNDYDLTKVSDEKEYTGSVAMPIGSTTLSMADILAKVDSNTYVKTDANNSLYFEYNSTLFSKSSKDVMTIPDQPVRSFYIESGVDLNLGLLGISDGFTISSKSSPLFSFLSDTFYVSVEFDNNAEFNSIVMSKGTMNLEVVSTFNHDIKIDFSAPSLKLAKRSTYYTDLIPVNANSSFSKAISLVGDSLIIDNYTDPITKKKVLRFPILLNAELTKKAGESLLSKDDHLEIKISLNNIDYKVVYGYAGTYEVINTQSSFPLADFTNSFLSGIQFAPIFTLTAKSSYGANIELIMQDAKMGDNPVVFNSKNNYAFQLSRPNKVGETQTSVATFDTTNTNIFKLLSSKPDAFTFNIKGTINPTSMPYDGSKLNFALDTSKLTVMANMYIPFSFKFLNDMEGDTMDIDFENLLNNFESFKFQLETRNGFPFSANLMLVILDEGGVHLDTIYNNTFIKGADTTLLKKDNYNIMSFPAQITDSKDITKKIIEDRKLETGKHVVVYVTGVKSSTGDDKFIPVIKDYYKMFIKLNIAASAKVDL